MTFLLIVVGYHPPGMTQAGGTFACDRTLYITRGQPTQLDRVNTNPFGLQTRGTADVEYNAIGYNPVDNFIYGMNPVSGIVYRISNDGQATAISPNNPPTPPTGFPPIPGGSFAFAGDINRNGFYYVYIRNAPAGQPNLFQINLSTNSVVSSLEVANTDFADISFNPVDNQIYAFDNTQRRLGRINLTNGTVEYFGPLSPGDPVEDVAGGSFFDAFGNFFGYFISLNPQQRGIYRLSEVNNLTTTGTSFEFQGNIPAEVSRLDGASCAYAPNLQKIVDPTPVVAGGIVTYRYRVVNQSPTNFTNLVFRDQMSDGRTFVNGTLTIPNGFGGTPNSYGGTSSLEISNITLPTPTSTTEITVQVRIPINATGILNNQATLSPLPSNTNDPTLPSDFPVTGTSPDPTPLQVTPAPPTPRIGLAKRVASSVNLGGGVFRVTYELVVNNLGNVDLNNVQVTEDLTTTFAQATSFTVSPNSVSSPTGNLAPNPNYNGRTDNPNLLAGTDTLTVGQSKTIQFIVDVTPGANLGPYNNQAVATGQSSAGPAEDLSQNGTNPDPDGDGIPTNNNDPTPVSFAENPVLGVAKAVASFVDAGNGNFTVTYNILVQNLGDVPLSNLQLTENLVNTFGTTPFTLPANPVRSPNSDLTPNPNYNGRTDLNLLAGTDTLAVGVTKTLQLVVTITPPNERRTFTNQVEGTATSPTGQSVRDLSTAGINPDPDNDRNPTNNDVPTPLPIGPNLRIVKRITNITRGGVPVSGVDFTSFTPDPGDDDDDAGGWSNLPGGVLSGIYRLNSDNPMQTGDEVEYTVYYLSDGSQPVTDAKICDPIPEKTTFIPNAFQPGQGILLNQQATNTSLTNPSDTDKGTFFSRLTPVTSPCPNTNNSNGSVLVQLGNLNITPPDNVGFIRFRVKID